MLNVNLGVSVMSTADVIATSSVVVAVLAFFVGAWQTWSTHRHNRLSVRPLLVWHVGRTADPGSSTIAYSVKNLGLGPAVIRDRYFTKDAARFLPPDLKTDEVGAFVEAVLGSKVPYKLRKFGLPGKRAAIPTQCEVVVAEIEFPGASPEQLKVIEEIAGETGFHIAYESMYGEAFELHVPTKDED